jgi:phosphate transport system substrate-binding protein
MKKIIMMLITLLVVAGCTATPAENLKINVYTRDATSGTREAFFGFIGIKEDLSKTAIEVASNGDMAGKVGADAAGIGYVSVDTDFEANNLMGLTYNGVEATVANVLDGSYELARPFNFVTRAANDYESADKKELVSALVDFMLNSKEGALAINAAGAIAPNQEQRVAWETLAAKYPVVSKDNSALVLTTGGSTSVEKALKKVLEAFQPLAGNFQFQMNQTGSGDGFKRVLGADKDSANRADIGFASRNFKAEETVDQAMATDTIAVDAIVVVVSKTNKQGIKDVTTEQILKIYQGLLTEFAALKK